MGDDPCPIQPGARGTVTRVDHHPSLGFTQVAVDWDNGRGLLLTLPPDQVRKLDPIELQREETEQSLRKLGGDQ